MHLSPGARTVCLNSELARKLERRAVDNAASREAKQRDMQAQWARQLAEMRDRDRAARRRARFREVKRLLQLHRLVAVFPAIARRRLSAGYIVAEVAAQHGIVYAEIIGHGRTRPIVLARREAIYRLRTETPLSMAQIGKALGGKDHTSVLHALRCYAEVGK